MKVHLIRHAKSEDAVKDIHQRDDSPIIVEGLDKTKFSHLNPERVYTSNILRAKQTAELLFPEYEVLDFIYEYRRPNVLNGKDRKEGIKFWDQYLPIIRADHDWKMDESESFNEIKARVKKLHVFLRKQPYNEVAVVGHGTFFRHFLGYRALGDDYSFGNYLDLLWHIKWDNLEIKTIEI